MWLVILSVLILLVPGSFAASSGVTKPCALPRGEVEHLQAHAAISERWVTAIRPSEDCASVLVWTYDSTQWASYSASESTCAEFQNHGGAAKYPGLSHCQKIPVFANAQAARDRALPYGISGDTTLIIHDAQGSRTYLMNSAGTHVLEISRGSPSRDLASEGPAVTRSKKGKKPRDAKYLGESSETSAVRSD